ncbi:DUF433 domain-containing protein [Halorhabdus salina]|uniref:DUF433 domain-containing protein n=1 Tax=Halorhabdus salina TaxID=2750670 RepID=UPI0015EF3706|nr:DUF433 domain-containing protein [Halorhabdus salina]
MSQQSARIVRDLLDEPHIQDRPIPVLTIIERVEGRGLDPQTVADRHDLDVGDVYAAVLYYHERPREFEEPGREREAIMDEIERDINRAEDVTATE